MYRLYGQRTEGGYAMIAIKSTLEEIEQEIKEMEGYYSYMIIENKGKGDNLLRSERLYKECSVEYVDNLKTDIKVNAISFTPSRAKKKEDLRKLTEEYIDR